MDLPESVTLKCLFCRGTQFEFDDEKEYEDDDLIRCASCNEMNLLGGLKQVAREEALELVKSQVSKRLGAIFKR